MNERTHIVCERISKGDNGCWNWNLRKDKDGYGRIVRDGKTFQAHRFSYEAFTGEIPSGLTLDHLCRNRACVNPAHLEPVTMLENVLRGEGLGVANSRKTHCPLGHEYTYRNGERICKKCQCTASAKYKNKKS